MRPFAPLQKTLMATLLPAFIASAAFAASAGDPGLTVHEWGTFTSLSASDGRPLGGLYVDASRLPAFVYGVPFFNFDASQDGWASLDKLRHVTVKMETPVLYFYAQQETDVDVKVRFNGGTISQWYPQCYDCETAPAGKSVDFAKAPYQGHIGWKAKVLAPGTVLPFTTTASGQETGEWTAPRNVGSNLIRGEKGEVEQFLFYRGLGSFGNTVKLAFQNDSAFTVTNDGDEDIAFAMVYDRKYADLNMSDAAILYSGPLKAHAKLSLVHHAVTVTDYLARAAMDNLLAAMVAAGLTTEEGRALLNTWYNGYFIEGGLKAFWIVPRAMTDRILPLTIIPAPTELKRVIVGRSEIFPPGFEKELRAALAADSLSKYSKDKYWMAYQDLLYPGKDWSAATGVSRYPTRNPSLYQSGRFESGRVRAESAPLFQWGARPADALGRTPAPRR